MPTKYINISFDKKISDEARVELKKIGKAIIFLSELNLLSETERRNIGVRAKKNFEKKVISSIKLSSASG